MAGSFIGTVFSDAGVGVVHVLPYPLGGACRVPYREISYQLFTEVFKTYGRKTPAGQMQLLKEKPAGLIGCTPTTLFDEIDTLFPASIAKNPLHVYGMKEKRIEGFTSAVIATR